LTSQLLLEEAGEVGSVKRTALIRS